MSDEKRAPYGYGFADDGVTLVEVWAEQEVMRAARTLYAAGLTVDQIKRVLASHGFVSEQMVERGGA